MELGRGAPLSPRVIGRSVAAAVPRSGLVALERSQLLAVIPAGSPARGAGEDPDVDPSRRVGAGAGPPAAAGTTNRHARLAVVPSRLFLSCV